MIVADQASSGVGVSRNTVVRDLHHGGLQGHHSRGTSLLNEQHIKARLRFAHEHLEESIWILPVVRVNVTTESCTLLCVVEKPAGTTLWWSKDEEKVKQSSSSLSLPLTIITQEFSSSYKCEAATPAEVKSLEVNVTALCSEDKNSEDENTNQTNARGTTVAISVVLTILVLVLAVPAGFFIKWKRSNKGQSTKDTQSKEPEADYSEIDFVRSQERASPRPTRPVDQSLTTIYAKLEVHNQDRDTSC